MLQIRNQLFLFGGLDMKRTISTFLSLAAMVLLVASCGKTNPAGKVNTTGQWLGFIVDAKTGEKLNFFGTANDESD
jgi:predicted small secreted protein